jgi:hypothetical protein
MHTFTVHASPRGSPYVHHAWWSYSLLLLLLSSVPQHASPLQVHTAHSNVPLLAPTLTSCLTTSLESITGFSSSSSGSGPLQIAAACFPGCVQLLANIFTLRKGSGNDSNNTGGDDDGSGGGCSASSVQKITKSWAAGDSDDAVHCGSGSSSVAAAVLSSVCGALLSLGQGVPDVDVTVGAAAASTKGLLATATAAAAAAAAASTKAAPAAASSDAACGSAEFPAVSLQCCEPPCLTAGEPKQQLTLQLQLHAEQQAKQGDVEVNSSSSSSSPKCRLVAFQDGAAVTDQEVTLQDSIIR